MILPWWSHPYFTLLSPACHWPLPWKSLLFICFLNNLTFKFLNNLLLSKPRTNQIHALKPTENLTCKSFMQSLRPSEKYLIEGTWFSICALSILSPGYCFATFLGQTLLYNFHLPRLNIGNYSWKHWDTAGIYGERGVKEPEWPWDWSHNRHDSKASKLLLLPTFSLLCPFLSLTDREISEMLKAKSKVKFREENLSKKSRGSHALEGQRGSKEVILELPVETFPSTDEYHDSGEGDRHRL